MKQKNRFTALILTLAMALSMGITASASGYVTEPTYDFDNILAVPGYEDSWVVTKTVDGTTQYGIMNTAGEMVVALSDEYIVVWDGGIYVTVDTALYLYQEGSDDYGAPLPEDCADNGDYGCVYDMETGTVYQGYYFFTLDDEGSFQGSTFHMTLVDDPATCTVMVATGIANGDTDFTPTQLFGYGLYVNGLITTGEKYFDALTIASESMLKAVSRYGEVTYVDFYGTNLTNTTYEGGSVFASKYDVAAVKTDGLWYFLANPLATTTQEEVETVLASGTASATASPILLDGETVEFDAYFIADNNYFKLRDIAAALDGTGSQFSVEWVQESETINLVTGASYETVGGELVLGDGSAKDFVASTASITVNGEVVELTAYNIADNNYFKLVRHEVAFFTVQPD